MHLLAHVPFIIFFQFLENPMTPESVFKTKLIRDLHRQFPGAIILKNDPGYIQGIPDHIILFGTHWAAFEAKAFEKAHKQPNQKYYIDLLNEMSYASFVYPENKEIFLDELQHALRPSRVARISRSV
jgi:hypothetical protein